MGIDYEKVIGLLSNYDIELKDVPEFVKITKVME
jgi:hypothetical protein